MRIELKQPHKSIKTLTTGDLPDFAVLTGRNGAGKTQLLDALMKGQAEFPGIGVDETELYDMVSFQPPNTDAANRNANLLARSTVDAYLLGSHGGHSLIESAAEIFDQFAGELEHGAGIEEREKFTRDLRDEIRQLPDFAVFPARRPASPYKKALRERVVDPLDSEDTKRQGNISSKQPNKNFDGNPAALLSAAMKLADKLPHELTYDDIMRASHYEGRTISNSISVVFAAYKLDQFIWAHNRIERESARFPDLIAEYRTTYPPPWEILRNILSAMRDAAGDYGLFDFDFSDPEDHQLRLSNYEQFSFKAEMTNRTTGARYELDSLSSGEKILMALCLTSFNQVMGRRRPKLLLLDELDALLHPSMVAALVTTLKSLFVQQGTKVLMTSHSPMTVAALDEADIFRVVRTGGHVDISRTTKSEAINELSEGLATVDTGLRIAAYDESRVTILTEGHNARHLKRWVELHFPRDVHVFDELAQHRSDSQLLAYGRLLGKMNTNTHFVIVWDCDAADKAETLRGDLSDSTKVTAFSFRRRSENNIARNGIENNYDEDFLRPYSITKSNSDGTLLGHEFPKDRKTEFADHVLHDGTFGHFTHFQDLHDVISALLGSTGNVCRQGEQTIGQQ